MCLENERFRRRKRVFRMAFFRAKLNLPKNLCTTSSEESEVDLDPPFLPPLYTAVLSP